MLAEQDTENHAEIGFEREREESKHKCSFAINQSEKAAY
jgi:hypothetical protein